MSNNSRYRDDTSRWHVIYCRYSTFDGVFIFFHSSFIFKLKGYNDFTGFFCFSFFLGRIYCVFLSSCCCVSTWHALLSVATSGGRKKDSSPVLCLSVRSMLRWVCFCLQCASDMEIMHWCSHGFCTGDWFFRSIIMLVRIWLTGETPLLLLDITERQSGKSIHSASCCIQYECWVINSDFLPVLGCTLPMSMLWTTLGISWRKGMSWWRQKSCCQKPFQFSMLPNQAAATLNTHSSASFYHCFNHNFSVCPSLKAWLCCGVDEPGYSSEQPEEVWRSRAELLECHPLSEKIPRLLL